MVLNYLKKHFYQFLAPMKTETLNSFNYLHYSKDLLTSVLFIFPLLILYEVLSFLIFYDKDYAIRNSADIFLRSYFYNIGTSSQFLYIIFLSLIVFIYIYVNRKNYYNYKFNSFFNIIMILEGLVYGFLLIIILNGYNYFLNTSLYVYDDFFLNFYFSLGAGVWEEILFRLFLLILHEESSSSQPARPKLSTTKYNINVFLPPEAK